MDRRRFVVTGLSAAVVGGALVTACSTRGGLGGLLPGSGGAANEELAGAVTVLNVQYATTNINGYKLRGRTYNGKTVGPTIVTRPGATLSMRIVNKLPPNVKAAAPRGTVDIPVVRNNMQAMNPAYVGPVRRSSSIDPMNNPHDFNTTNLHVHGIQTVPHLFAPVGTSDPAADMIAIEPGKSFQYDFPVPKNHPSGLHWYHPHHHGSTDVQVSNGMAGLIVVRGPVDEVPEIKAAREFFIVVQTLEVNPSKTVKGTYDREYVPYRTGTNGGYRFLADYTMLTTNGKGVCWIDNRTPTYTPMPLPQFNMRPGEVVRIRLLNGTNYLPLMLMLPGFQVWQIGFDGVNTLVPIPKDMSGKGTPIVNAENVLDAPVRFALSGNRIELLIRAPKTAGTYTLSSLANTGLFGDLPTIGLAKFVVAGAPVTMGIPAKLPVPTREYPVITDKEIVARREFTLSQGENLNLLTGFGFTVNDKLYQMTDVPFYPKVGTCEEWTIVNNTDDAHPFHLHTNSFQLIAVNGKTNYPMEIWDTFMVPPKVNGQNGSIVFRVRFLEWFGKDVFHCHILPHEDTGMMMNFLMA